MRAVFVGSALLAELMVAISSKGHGEGVVNDRSVDDSIIALAADLIAKQPKAMENALIEQVSHYLGSPNILALKDSEIAEQLRAQLSIMRDNPWAKCGANRSINTPLPQAAQR